MIVVALDQSPQLPGAVARAHPEAPRRPDWRATGPACRPTWPRRVSSSHRALRAGRAPYAPIPDRSSLAAGQPPARIAFVDRHLRPDDEGERVRRARPREGCRRAPAMRRRCGPWRSARPSTTAGLPLPRMRALQGGARRRPAPARRTRRAPRRPTRAASPSTSRRASPSPASGGRSRPAASSGSPSPGAAMSTVVAP